MGPTSHSIEPHASPVPTRLLIGVMLILWGALSEHPIMGVLAAILVEGHRWVRWRWPFSPEDYVRIWNLCVALFIFVAVFQFIGRDMAALAFNRVFQRWMPILLLPIVLAQYYGTAKSIPIVTFSLLARRKRQRDHQIGRSLEPVKSIHVGYFYVGVLLLSIGSLTKGLPGMFILVALLLGWVIYPFVPASRVVRSAVVFVFAISLGFFIQQGLSKAHAYLENRSIDWLRNNDSTDGDRSTTRIGEIGEEKHLSNEIAWRLTYLEGERPDLIRETVYDRFRHGTWLNSRRLQFDEVLPAFEGNEQDWEIYPLQSDATKGALKIRGTVKGEREILPAPMGLAFILNLPAHHVERNAVGTFRFRPRNRALGYTTFFGELPPGIADAIPDSERDFHINPDEKIAVRGLVNRDPSLSRQGEDADKVSAVKEFFGRKEFTYAQYIPGSRRNREQAIDRFLTETRSGHCEYYATATVLLLREMGVPARYAVGFAAREYDEDAGEFLLRGVHRHAWALAWVNGRWVNVDTTPADWLSYEATPLTRWERFRDVWQERLLSFNLWRHQDDKGIWWSIIPLLLAAGMLALVVLRIVRGMKKPTSTEIATQVAKARGAVVGADSEWYRVEKELAQREVLRNPAMTPRDWYHHAVGYFPRLERELSELISLHYRLRFDPLGLNDQEREQLRTGADNLIETLRKSYS